MELQVLLDTLTGWCLKVSEKYEEQFGTVDITLNLNHGIGLFHPGYEHDPNSDKVTGVLTVHIEKGKTEDFKKLEEYYELLDLASQLEGIDEELVVDVAPNGPEAA